MQIDAAIAWVKANSGRLAKRAQSYGQYTPYAVSDYLQDANEAAIKAAIVCQRDPSKNFEAVFFVLWKKTIASVTPFPDEARERYKSKKNGDIDEEYEAGDINPGEKKKTYSSGGTSMSFPSCARSDIDLDRVSSRKRTRTIDIEKVYYQSVKPRLSPREADACERVMGLTSNGRMSLSEIANELGVNKSTVAEYLDRAMAKINKDASPKKDKKKNEPILLEIDSRSVAVNE